MKKNIHYLHLLISRDIFNSACLKRESEENVSANSTGAQTSTTTATTESSSENNYKSFSETLADEETPKDIDFENVFMSKFSSFNSSTRAMMGHRLVDMVRFCTFKGKTCNL